jgi:hypothetical protein
MRRPYSPRAAFQDPIMFNLPVDAAIGSIETLLYSISNVLYLPVLLGIAALVLHMLVCFGTFGAEWLERRRGVRVLVATARQQMPPR